MPPLTFLAGQMREPSALPYLNDVLANEKENSMVRHEVGLLVVLLALSMAQAGEALGAIGMLESLLVLERYCKDPLPEVAETCNLAIDRIRYYQKRSAFAFWRSLLV
jgi:deoxyhypusine monooxygenase